MDREFAIQARDVSIEAARVLLSITKLTDNWDEADMQRLRRAIGITVGKIEMEILGEIYSKYPDIDHLA